MVLNTIIMNLLGNISYKKYVSIVSGMILVLIVVSPLFHLLKLNDKFDYFLQSNDFALETADFQNNLKDMEEQQSDAIFEEYQTKIEKQVESLLLEDNLKMSMCKVNIDRDAQSDTFGEIKSLTVTADYTNKQEASKDKKENNKIEIESIEINKSEDKAVMKIPSLIEISVKNKLSDFYNMEPANINISIQGG